MKAISIKQPWANLIAYGIKTIETRTWKTKYRGRLLIVSSKKPSMYPCGSIVAVADIVDCRDMDYWDVGKSCCPLYPKAKSWVLDNVVAVKPVPVKGAMGIYDIEVEESSLIKMTPSFILSEINDILDSKLCGIPYDVAYYHHLGELIGRNEIGNDPKKVEG